MEIIRRINPHFPGKYDPLCGVVFVAHPQYFDIKKRNGIIGYQFKEESAGPAPAHNGNIQ
jgi:hypothetical protein